MVKIQPGTGPLIVIVIGLLVLLLGAKFPALTWAGISWGNFLSSLGLYVTVVVAFQWYYDKRTKDRLVVSVMEAALSTSSVVRSGIAKFQQDTKKIDYDTLLDHRDEIVIGFLHSSRLVDDNFSKLKQRAATGKKTTILLSNPEGEAIKYLLSLATVKSHIMPSIEKIIRNVDEQINQDSATREKISIKHHDAVLRYSFVHSKDGIWVKMYRNSAGLATTPGIYVLSGSPLYDFFDQDVENLAKGAVDV